MPTTIKQDPFRLGSPLSEQMMETAWQWELKVKDESLYGSKTAS
jgi:hypothetical protein